MPKTKPCRYCKSPLDPGRLSSGICLNCVTATELRKLIDSWAWKTYKKDSDVPQKEICLFVVANMRGDKQVCSGVFNRDANGKPIGNIGGRFHFDWPKIYQWMSVQYLIELAELDEGGQ